MRLLIARGYIDLHARDSTQDTILHKTDFYQPTRSSPQGTLSMNIRALLNPRLSAINCSPLVSVLATWVSLLCLSSVGGWAACNEIFTVVKNNTQEFFSYNLIFGEYNLETDSQ